MHRVTMDNKGFVICAPDCIGLGCEVEENEMSGACDTL